MWPFFWGIRPIYNDQITMVFLTRKSEETIKKHSNIQNG